MTIRTEISSRRRVDALVRVFAKAPCLLWRASSVRSADVGR